MKVLTAMVNLILLVFGAIICFWGVAGLATPADDHHMLIITLGVVIMLYSRPADLKRQLADRDALPKEWEGSGYNPQQCARIHKLLMEERAERDALIEKRVAEARADALRAAAAYIKANYRDAMYASALVKAILALTPEHARLERELEVARAELEESDAIDNHFCRHSEKQHYTWLKERLATNRAKLAALEGK